MLRFIKRHVKVARFLVLFLTIMLCAEPAVFAQTDGRTRQFDRPLENGGGDSFRQNPLTGQGQNSLQRQQDSLELMNRGTMMSQSTMSGLLYQVHILGEVKSPGTYRVMASERLAEVLQRAGGVLENGSRRSVEIRRDGKVVKNVDLLKFQLYGQLDHNPYLLDNDVIFVPLRKDSVQVVGAVKRPEVYELLGEKSVMSAIKLAGGFSAGVAKNEPVRVIRFTNGQKEVLEIGMVDDAELSKASIQNGDVVYIPNVITAGHEFDYDIAKLPGDNVFYPSYEDRVFVLGGIQVPGAYPFNPYYNIHQYISLAGGYTKLSTKKMTLLSPEGTKTKITKRTNVKINPGDTILIGERRVAPEGWVNLFMSVAGFGLSTTATVITLTR